MFILLSIYFIKEIADTLAVFYIKDNSQTVRIVVSFEAYVVETKLFNKVVPRKFHFVNFVSSVCVWFNFILFIFSLLFC